MRTFRDAVRNGWAPPEEMPATEAAGKRRTAGREQSPPPRTAKTTNLYAADVAATFRAAVREGLLLAILHTP